jgi:hypothetical protein
MVIYRHMDLDETLRLTGRFANELQMFAE